MKQNLLAFHLCHVPVPQEMGTQLVPTSVEGGQVHGEMGQCLYPIVLNALGSHGGTVDLYEICKR